MFRLVSPSDTEQLLAIAEATSIFQPGETEDLLGATLKAFHAGELGEGHQVQAWEDATSRIVGWTYFSPSNYASGVWDVWWIGADPSVHGKGFGKEMLKSIEEQVKEKKGRIIIIETSSAPPLSKARNFYPKAGYQRCGQIPNFYGPGDDKIIFSKTL